MHQVNKHRYYWSLAFFKTAPGSSLLRRCVSTSVVRPHPVAPGQSLVLNGRHVEHFSSSEPVRFVCYESIAPPPFTNPPIHTLVARSGGRTPPINGQYCAVDETRFITREKDDRRRDLFGAGGTTRGSERSELVERFTHLGGTFRARRSGADGVHANTTGTELGRPTLW